MNDNILDFWNLDFLLNCGKLKLFVYRMWMCCGSELKDNSCE